MRLKLLWVSQSITMTRTENEVYKLLANVKTLEVYDTCTDCGSQYTKLIGLHGYAKIEISGTMFWNVLNKVRYTCPRCLKTASTRWELLKRTVYGGADNGRCIANR